MVRAIIDDEVWKKYLYLDRIYYLSNKGNIKSEYNNILVQKLDKYGYLRVRLKNNSKIKSKDKRISKLAHRLIYKAFYPNCEDFDNLTINHIDGNKLNNNIENLELITQSENNKHAYKTGLKNNSGENHPRHKLSNIDILEIRKLYNSNNITQVELARKFNVSQSVISSIVLNKIWNK